MTGWRYHARTAVSAMILTVLLTGAVVGVAILAGATAARYSEPAPVIITTPRPMPAPGPTGGPR